MSISDLFATGYTYPLPPDILAKLSDEYGETPLVVDSCALAVWEGKRREQWREWEEEYIREHFQEMSDEEMATALKRSRDSVRDKRISMGLRRSRSSSKP